MVKPWGEGGGRGEVLPGLKDGEMDGRNGGGAAASGL
jgi:hypothetical protein